MYRTTSGTGTFFAEFRPIAGGAKKRIKLGRVGTLKANEAREAARKAIAHAGLGKDLAKDRSDLRSSQTVKTLVSNYLPSFRCFRNLRFCTRCSDRSGHTTLSFRSDQARPAGGPNSRSAHGSVR
ncbi:DUF4102 domain-containing protein [Rhizobium sp. CCGE531]|nr:DUF4102 domain-containing protein [Rhizobium sp. CCGE531]AYG72266.1 DUF4102 domain-containing protein [Rhizobium sp. CCGE532]